MHLGQGGSVVGVSVHAPEGWGLHSQKRHIYGSGFDPQLEHVQEAHVSLLHQMFISLPFPPSLSKTNFKNL